MYDTSLGGFQVAGPCPSTHPVRMPQLAYETLWNTTGFNDKSLWPRDGSQPFVWSMNDHLGYGSHGDYVFGWQGDSLQAAMNSSCMFADCGTNNTPLKAQGGAQMSQCKVQPTVTEETEGCKFSCILDKAHANNACSRAHCAPRPKDGHVVGIVHRTLVK